MVTFSVLIPAYQAERTLEATIRSALSQTHPAQVVVCDDGSTDRTPEIIRSFGDAVTVVTKPNGGLSTARNAALGVATGDFVVLLDADDVMRSTRLERIAGHIAATGDDIVTTEARMVDEAGQFIGLFYGARPFPQPAEQRLAILGGNFLFVSSAIRTIALRSIGGFDERTKEQGEYEGWIRLILAGARAGIIREPLADYMVRSDSLSAAPTYNRRHAIHALQRATAAHNGNLSDHEIAVARKRLGELLAVDTKAAALARIRAGERGARRGAVRAALVRPSTTVSRAKFVALAIAPRSLARRA